MRVMLRSAVSRRVRCVRFFKRKSHAADLLSAKLEFCVLALGDSNMLLDRQTTTARAPQHLHARFNWSG